MAASGGASNVMFGINYPIANDLPATLLEASEAAAEFICVPLTPVAEPHADDQPAPRMQSATILSSQDWTMTVVGHTGSLLQLDSPDHAVRRQSEEQFKAELSWASHLSLPAIAVPLHSAACANLAATLNATLCSPLNSRIWIRVPLTAPSSGAADGDDTGEEEDTWRWWNTFRLLCKSSTRLSVALDLTANLPSPARLARWLGEPVRSIFIDTSVFLTNSKGYPVLSKAHQALMRSLLKLKPQVVVSHGADSMVDTTPYIRYLRHLSASVQETDPVKMFAQGYEDYLQAPLQPLMDNLESQTYETFEKDPVKYVQYREAVQQALVDRVAEADKETTTTVVMVVGAGRGPLVEACLRAATESQRKIRVHAVDKNPNAVITLHARNAEEWDNVVNVVSTDMRHWTAPEQADILVSELLGSFGDNELSPECLDGAQKYLKEGGISIPSRYTSYLAPVSSHKLHADLVAHSDPKHLETPFVVLLHNVFVMSAVQPCFCFEHPAPTLPPDNSRYGAFDFPVAECTSLHGFAGYFDAVLYKDVMISIHPDTHSAGMFSWFPIFFPLKEPMLVPANSSVRVHLWRKVSPRKVWYEWATEQPQVSRIHNACGEAYAIGL
eukprot:m.314126 g.314126  ORF g.314126 m.314126 type:complete len:612 (-) comp19666_c0_seq12:84-1919(-)